MKNSKSFNDVNLEGWKEEGIQLSVTLFFFFFSFKIQINIFKEIKTYECMVGLLEVFGWLVPIQLFLARDLLELFQMVPST